MPQLEVHDGQPVHQAVPKDTTKRGAPSSTGSPPNLPGDGGGESMVGMDSTAGKRGQVPNTGKPDKLDPTSGSGLNASNAS